MTRLKLLKSATLFTGYASWAEWPMQVTVYGSCTARTRKRFPRSSRFAGDRLKRHRAGQVLTNKFYYEKQF